MTQQYGFRVSNNLSEVDDQNVCLANLGIDKRDIAIVAFSASGNVRNQDFQALKGLSSTFEEQAGLFYLHSFSLAVQYANRASVSGSKFEGNIVVNSINNDRPYVTQSGTIIGPSTTSYFSPTASGLFSTGGEYKLGPVTAGTVTTSGVNYKGETTEWSNYFSRYKLFATVQEQPSWVTRRVPLYLPPPTKIDGCVVWLDSEFSEFKTDANNFINEWKNVGAIDINGRSVAEGYRPLLVQNVLNGKPAVRFDGALQFLEISTNESANIAGFFPSGATLVIKARSDDNSYNLFATTPNTINAAWSTINGDANFDVFTLSPVPGQKVKTDSNTTTVFSVSNSPSTGFEFRSNGQVTVKQKTDNLLLENETFNTSTYYTKNFLNITPNAIVAPDGSLTAFKIAANTVNTYHNFANDYYLDQYSGVNTFSVYAKAAESKFIALRILGTSNFSRTLDNGGYTTVFYLEGNGEIYSEFSGSANNNNLPYENAQASIVDVGNGWYRCSITAKTYYEDLFRYFVVDLVDDTQQALGYAWNYPDYATNLFAGDGTRGVYIWGLQMNQGSVALPYVKNLTPFNYKPGNYSFGSYALLGTSWAFLESFKGDVYSFALFNRVLSERELRTVEEYFNWRYDGVYDPDRTQLLQLEDFTPIELEDGTDLIA